MFITTIMMRRKMSQTVSNSSHCFLLLSAQESALQRNHIINCKWNWNDWFSEFIWNNNNQMHFDVNALNRYISCIFIFDIVWCVCNGYSNAKTFTTFRIRFDNNLIIKYWKFFILISFCNDDGYRDRDRAYNK